jgi:6,7-dimethyl-8-ribityllumazine synthase
MATNYKSKLDLDLLRDAANKKFAIVYSEWNDDIVNRLVNGAIKFFSMIGLKKEEIALCSVPGSFELVYACKKLCDENKYDAIIAIGSIIRGETKHFDFICNSVFNGLKDLNAQGICPVVACVLTDENIKQSLERSGGKFGNKGFDCAAAAAKMTLI